jgi:hypothetical protein
LLRRCAPGETSLEDPHFQKGIFTHFLLEGLTGMADLNGDGMISFLELYMYTQGKTQAHALRNHRSQQNPYIKGEVSDFPFARSFAQADTVNTAGASAPSSSESPRSDPQTEVLREMIDELRTLREERNTANRLEQDRRIAELEQQIDAVRTAPRQVVTQQPRPQSQPIPRAKAVQMVNQHNFVAPAASTITGATRQELIQYVQQHGALPRELLNTMPNNRQQKSKATYR